MGKNHVLLKGLMAASVVMMPFAAEASSEDPSVYIAVRSGISKSTIKETDNFDVEPTPFMAAVGTKFAGSPFRAEFEYSNYSDMKYTYEAVKDDGLGPYNFTQDAKYNMHTFMANIFLDMSYEECCPPLLRPYIFAGIGVSYLNASVKNYNNGTYTGSKKDSDWPWVWNIGAGVDVAINQAVFLEFRARYLKTFTADEMNVEVESKDLLVGVRFNMY